MKLMNYLKQYYERCYIQCIVLNNLILKFIRFVLKKKIVNVYMELINLVLCIKLMKVIQHHKLFVLYVYVHIDIL